MKWISLSFQPSLPFPPPLSSLSPIPPSPSLPSPPSPSLPPSLSPPPPPPPPPPSLSLSLSQQVVMGLLDLVVHYNPTSGAANRYSRFASEVAHKALNLMILLRPVTMVSTLAKEVAMFLASQHITHVPHSSLQPQQVRLLHVCK